VAQRKPFILRVDPALHEALQRWARDELRSLNAQVEYLLRESLARAGRLPDKKPPAAPGDVTRPEDASPTDAA